MPCETMEGSRKKVRTFSLKRSYFFSEKIVLFYRNDYTFPVYRLLLLHFAVLFSFGKLGKSA